MTAAEEKYHNHQCEAIKSLLAIGMKIEDTPSRINWGRVGSMSQLCIQLKEIEDQSYHTGEYAS